MEASPADHGPAIEAHRTMIRMISGYWVSQMVHCAARLSLADLLAPRPLTAEAVASACELDVDATFRFLRACAALGIVGHQGGKFTATPLLETLSSHHPASLKGRALGLVTPGQWQPWGRLESVLKHGCSQAEAVLGSDLFTYHDNHPEEASAFTQAMDGFTQTLLEDVTGAVAVPPGALIVDIGGASGLLLRTLLQANPDTRGIVFDRPAVAAATAESLRGTDLAARVTAEGGDFFVAVPAADRYLLKHILHNWSDDDCVTLLRNCHRRMHPGGRVVVFEMLMGEIGEGDPTAALVDLHMLVALSGRERTPAEYRRLFEAAGFARMQVTPLRNGWAMLEAWNA